MIQVKNLPGAYPATYLTMQNVDFGTVKGLTVKYDLRRTNNISLIANYTLQFADGTGSSTVDFLQPGSAIQCDFEVDPHVTLFGDKTL